LCLTRKKKKEKRKGNKEIRKKEKGKRKKEKGKRKKEKGNKEIRKKEKGKRKGKGKRQCKRKLVFFFFSFFLGKFTKFSFALLYLMVGAYLHLLVIFGLLLKSTHFRNIFAFSIFF
jgi:hypothetical protein